MSFPFVDPINQQIKTKLETHELYTNESALTWTKPDNVDRIWVTMCGAGGDGGDSVFGAGGGGGGSGAYCIDVEIPLPGNLELTCGAGVD